MLDWIDNKEACYVLAAYGCAVVAFLGLFFFSFRAFRQRKAEWTQLKGVPRE